MTTIAYMLVSFISRTHKRHHVTHALWHIPSQLSFLMFHHVTGIPFQSDLHGGAYDDLTLWEQIDEGAQYTPAKKWLICLPIGL